MKNMAKIWKKILLAVLIIACLFDVTSKIVKRYSLKEELESSATYLEQRKNNEQKQNKVLQTIEIYAIILFSSFI